MNPMLVRQQATTAAMEAFNGQPLVWGETDCARLAAFVLKRLGYKANLSKFGFYKTETAARAALKRKGFADLSEVVDQLLPRINFASSVLGDIVGYQHTDDWMALTIKLNNGRVLGFHPDAEGCACSVIAPTVLPSAVWSAAPCLLSQ